MTWLSSQSARVVAHYRRLEVVSGYRVIRSRYGKLVGRLIELAWLFHSILGRAGSRQRLTSALQSQRPRSARHFRDSGDRFWVSSFRLRADDLARPHRQVPARWHATAAPGAMPLTPTDTGVRRLGDGWRVRGVSANERRHRREALNTKAGSATRAAFWLRTLGGEQLL